MLRRAWTSAALALLAALGMLHVDEQSPSPWRDGGATAERDGAPSAHVRPTPQPAPTELRAAVPGRGGPASASAGGPARAALTTDDDLGTREPRPGARSVQGARYAIPIWGGTKHLIVRATLNGTLSGPMLVDTGASYCVLTRAAARRLGVSGRRSDSVPVATANGHVRADLVTLGSLEIAEARVAGIDAVVMDAVEPPLIGIIGLSFLNHFRYSVDHLEGTIQLER